MAKPKIPYRVQRTVTPISILPVTVVLPPVMDKHSINLAVGPRIKRESVTNGLFLFIRVLPSVCSPLLKVLANGLSHTDVLRNPPERLRGREWKDRNRPRPILRYNRYPRRNRNAQRLTGSRRVLRLFVRVRPRGSGVNGA